MAWSRSPETFALDEFDPRWPEFRADPFPFYTRFQREEPVAFVRSVAGGIWMVTRYHDITYMLQHDELFGKEQPEEKGAVGAASGLPKSMLMLDPPDHTRLRGLISKAFTPRTVEGLRPRIAVLAHELLDQVKARGEMDLVADFAFPLPAIVIAEMLGVPPEDRERFKGWSNALARGLGGDQPPEVYEASRRATWEIAAYFMELVDARRKEPRPDVISELIAIEEEGERLTHAELLATLILLLVAGHETTTNLISSGILALLQHPDQLESLRRQPELAPQATEELLRFCSPVQRTGRVVQRDVEFGGKLLSRGQTVLTFLAAANRDPAVFDRPDELDLTRKQNPHMGFGRGIHFCLGAPLAKVEGQIAFTALLERLPGLKLAGQPKWNANTVIRGLSSLLVQF